MSAAIGTPSPWPDSNTPSIRVYAPATIGNFAAGFDVLGAALAPDDGSLWGDVVTVRPLPAGRPPGRVALDVEGDYAGELPVSPRRNLAWTCRQLFAREMRRRGGRIAPVAIHLRKNLPLCSGLGSSASSVVATLVALNAYHDQPLTNDELLVLAGRGEATVSGAALLDNVAPCLLGGLQLLVSRPRRTDAPCGGGASATPAPLPFFDDWRVVVVHPDVQVPTRRARAVLPKAIPQGEAVAYWQNLAAFVHALHVGDRGLAATTLRDVWIEKHRRRLVRGFAKVKAAALTAGALGCSFSGSGPSMFAVVPDHGVGRRVRGAMVSAFGSCGVASEGRICMLDRLGARVLT